MEKPSRSYVGKRTNFTALFFSKSTVFCKKRSFDDQKKPSKWRSIFGKKKEYKFEIIFKHEEEIENNFEDFDALLNYYSKHMDIRPIGRKYTSVNETISLQTNSASVAVTTNSEISIEFEKHDKAATLNYETKEDFLKNSFIYRTMEVRSRKKTFVKPKWLISSFNFLS